MKMSLSKISFLNILITAIGFSIVIGFVTVQVTQDSYEQRIIDLEKNYILKNKQLVKDEVNRAIKRIETLEKISYTSLRNSLEEKVNLVFNIFNNTKQQLTKQQLINKYKNELDYFKWDNNTGYFYIFDNNGLILYHGANQTLENKSIFDLTKNNVELESFIKDTMKKDANFGIYSWSKPNEKISKLYKKYVFARKIPEHNLYIAAGIYKNEFEKKVQKLVIKELEKERFGEDSYGYFWMHNLDSKILMHPINKELVNTNLSTFKTLDGQLLFPNINKLVKEKEQGFISYKWYKPNSNIQDEKISYVQLIKEWDIVVGSGFYLTELKDLLKSEKLKLKDNLSNNLKKILFVILTLVVLSLIMAWFISKKIKKVEDEQKEHLNMLEQYQLILDKSVVVSKANTDGIITYVNNNFVKVSGYKDDEVLGKPHSIVRHPETPKSQFKYLWKNIQKGKIWRGILKNKKKNGESYYNSTTIVPIKDSDGNILEYISSGSDVTELFENRSKLKEIFKTDSLTGLGNRVSLIDNISKNSNGILALVNIDRFKEVNDIYGHDIGDKIIQELGSRLFEFLKEESYVLYRVQADIFALFTTKDSLEEVCLKVEKFMSQNAKKTYNIDDNNFSLTYTSGIASNSQNLFSYADMALSEAKNKKIKLKVYDDAMNNIKEFQQNILWVEKLHLALDEDRIIPYFQPIYNYHTKRIEKYECLMRLLEDGKIVSPDEYLDIAKKTKLYPELTYKMVTKSINKFATNDLEFSINLSIEDLMNDELMVFIYDLAEQKNVFSRMVLEIVESEEIEDSDAVGKAIKRFKEKGSKVAIDDFGSGYSNYEYLISLQADYVKIDGSITKHILEDERTAEVVKSIVTFAKKSNMKTIAEFVSSPELDAKVIELGVDYAQGWHYGKAEKELLN